MTINDINALTFDTIQGYEESKGVAKNRNTRYRTAKYIAPGQPTGKSASTRSRSTMPASPPRLPIWVRPARYCHATIKPPMTPSGRKPSRLSTP